MLTSKQRAYLRSLANGIDTILMVGKGGMSEQIEKQALDALKARELIKGRVLETCELSPREAAEMIAEAVKADVVQVIGTKFVLYKRNEKEPKIELVKDRKKFSSCIFTNFRKLLVDISYIINITPAAVNIRFSFPHITHDKGILRFMQAAFVPYFYTSNLCIYKQYPFIFKIKRNIIPGVLKVICYDDIVFL